MSAAETFLDGRVTLYPGDCRATIAELPDNSVDAVVTDPPYALDSIRKRFGKAGAAPAQFGRDGAFARSSGGFMGQQWDTGETAFDPEFWADVRRVLKPGGHVAAFSHSTTWDFMLGALRAAGFEIRDTILDAVAGDTAVGLFMASLNAEQQAAFFKCLADSPFGGLLAWVYGSGFPKSLDVSKAIDKAAGRVGETLATGGAVKRMIPGATQNAQGWEKTDGREYQPGEYTPATPEAAQWQGWGTALKPAFEPIVLARKPLAGTVAENVLAHGPGGLNIDACRVVWESGADAAAAAAVGFAKSRAQGKTVQSPAIGKESRGGENTCHPDRIAGRWPANVVHDGSAEVTAGFPDTGPSRAGRPRSGQSGDGWGMTATGTEHNDLGGSAARFFYSAKADADDRIGSGHPTVKPVDLMAWLVRLVTPPGGTVLEPFAGSGTTGEAAFRGGFNAILCEREPAYCDDIRRRMALALAGPATRRAERAKAKAARRGEDDSHGSLFGSAA